MGNNLELDFYILVYKISFILVFKLIQKSLEQEFGLINISREAALSSTSGEAEKRLLTNTGKSFEWSDLKRAKLEFAECSAHQLQQEEGTGGGGEQYSLSPIREWIEAL